MVDHSKEQSTMEYSNSDLVKNTDLKGYSYTYDYDSKHNMTKATNQNGITYNYAYNSGGLATSLNINATGTYTIKSEVSYNSNGLLQSATDQNKVKTTYAYNNATGTLTSFTDDSGTTKYSYDKATNNLTEAKKDCGSGNVYSVGYTYSDDGKQLNSITHNDTSYNLTYDVFGNKTSSKVGSQPLATYTYSHNNGPLTQMTYGTGQTVGYTYDAYGNTASQSYNGKTAFHWTADRSGAIVREYDYINNIMYDYVSDSTGRAVRQVAVTGTASGSGNKTWYSTEYGYDLNNNMTRLTVKSPYRSSVNKYTYGKDNLPTKYTMPSGRSVTYTYDALNRLTNTSLSTETPVTTTYSYVNNTWGSKTTTTRLRAENINGTSYQYVYDSLGNITEIKNGSGKALNTYTYDKMSQLIGEVDYVHNKKIDYTYDTAGNILSETISDIDADGNTVGTSVVHSYAYENSEWKDKLTAYDGQEITYDKIGNPLTYRDGMTMTWKNGRQLATLQNAEHTISYSYDSGSVRVSKNVDGVESKYAYMNGLLVYEVRGGMRFYYCYDANGMLYSVNFTRYDGAGISTYYFSHNSRGDIIGIYDGSGTLQAKYEYDSWGNVLSITDVNGNAITSATHIGNLNPFRYRGYYYDSESGLYYLMSRYYDPATHRFINADGYFQAGGDILDVNMFTYCENNPIVFIDDYGDKCYLNETGRAGPPCPGSDKKDCCYIYNGYDYRSHTYVLYTEHHKKGTTNPSNKNKHERGQSRKNKDAGNEKGDKRRKEDRSNKRHKNSSYLVNVDEIYTYNFDNNFGERLLYGSVGLLSLVSGGFLWFDDVSGVGVADDVIAFSLTEYAWDCFQKVIS